MRNKQVSSCYFTIRYTIGLYFGLLNCRVGIVGNNIMFINNIDAFVFL